MASEFLKRKAEERAKIIDQKYGKGAYGSTADLNKKRAEAKKETSKSSSTKSGGAKTEKSQASSVGSKVGSILGKTTPSVGLPISSSTKKTTDFNSESQNVYKNVKNKTTAKTTTTSNLTEKQRKARIKDIDAELKNLNIKLGGYSRAKAYGTSKAMEAEEQKVKDRISELSKEKKTLQRTGTFTAAELKQFEIDDAKAKKSALPTYNPTSRVAPSGVEAYKKNIAAHSALDKEIDTLERQKELYDDINDFSEVVHKEDSGKGLGAWVNNFDSQWRATYRSNKLSREADKAAAKYHADPTEENKQLAYAYDALAREYAKNNEEALDDENVSASWLTKTLAGYLPQFEDQIIPELVGGGLGGLLGSAVGAPNVGASIGAGIGTYSQSYDVMRGSVYRTLLAEGVDSEIASQAAEDEALISSLIEGGETALSWLLMGGGKAISAVVGAAKSSVAKGSTSAATKFIANMATKGAAKKAVSTATTPLWKTGVKTALGIGLDAGGEYIEEFAQQGVSIANKERALQGETGKGNLIKGASKLTYDALTGKNSEALAEMHEAGTEGFKIGLMMGGSKVITTNVISHYANAKTVKNQNEILDTIIKDDETLTALIKEGKASGEGTVSAKIAKEVEQAKESGKVTRNHVKSLIAANEVYIQEEAKYNADPLELAAMEVVNSETKQTTPTTIKSIKKTTGFGDEGAKLVSTLMDSDGLTLEQAEGVVKTAYVAGTTNVEKAKVSFATPVQEQAFDAGKTDRIMDDNAAKSNVKKATVYEGSFTENEYTKNFSDAQKKMISIVSKDFGMDSSVVDKIIADKVTGAEANASHEDGVMQISSTAEQVIHELVLHESGHRMKQLAPTEFGVLMDALYERSMRNNQRAGIPLATNYDYIKAQHNNAGITLSTGGYLEEFAVRELETIFESAEEFNNWVSEIDSNPQVKSAWRKFVDWIAQIVEDIKRAISQRNMNKEERAEANRQLAELEHIKELYADAYKAARGVVSERKTVQKPEAKKGTTSKTQNLSKERQASDNTVSEEGEITNRTKKVLSGEKAVGVADGQAYVSDGKVFVPVNNVNVAKAELGATESKKVGENISKLLTKSDFTPINENYVDGNLEGVGAVRLFTDEKGREIALKKEIAEYFEGYNLEATFRGGKPYAIKATDNNGNVVGAAMAVWISTSGQKYKITDAKEASTKNTKNKTGATERATTNKEIAPNKKSEPQTKTEGIKEGDIFVAKKAGTTYKILSRDDRDTIVEITSAEGTKRTIISNEIADRNLINMSDEGITKWIDEDSHIDNRTWEDVGSRQVKAFQYLFPEMREYYMPLARELLSDLSNTIKGERIQIGTYEQGDQEWIGVSRMTSDAIARIKDTTNASYDEIENALERLINDKGQENIALAKRIELVFDDMLTDGYKTFEGEKIPPNEEYITKKEALIGKTYEGKNADEDLDWLFDTNFSLKNKNLTIDSRIPFTVLKKYINVGGKNKAALNNLEAEVRNLKRETYQNDPTGYRARITGDTIGKAIKPTTNKAFSPFTIEHIRNLNAIRMLPELFKKAVYVDSLPPQKGKNQNQSYKEFHHFVAPLFMNHREFRALITAREKVNSNTLYVLKVDVLPTQKKAHSLGNTAKNAVGSQSLSVPSDISIPELVNGVNIFNYDTNTDKVYSDKDIKFSLKDSEYLELAKDPIKNEARLRELVYEAARKAFPNSKITTKDGKLRIVYHGTNTGDFTVFNPDYIGMSSGDDGFFGMGFYFAYSKGEASYYGAKRIIPAYLNLKNPFNFDKELQTYKGKKASSGYAPDAVAFMNFADKFQGIAKNITVDVLEKDSDTYKALPLSEFSKAFKDVIENKEFEYQEIKNEYGETETLVLADPQQHEYEYNGKTHKYKDYGFEKRFWDKPNELDVAYEYLSRSVYSRIDMYNKTRLILDNNKEFTNALKDMGYDGAIQSEYGDEAVAFDSEQIKSAEPVTYDDNGNVIPLSERFNEKNDDIRYSLKDSEGNTLSEGQKEFFKDTKVKDENGNLLVVYHGSPAKFTVFDHSHINAHGNSHGRGFYFTEKKSLAEGFEKGDGQLLEGYLNITNPLSEDKVTIQKANLHKLIKATCKAEAQSLVDDDGYDNINEALRDTWISNYVDTYSTSLNDAYREVTDIIYSANDNDVEMVAELTNAGAGTGNTLRLVHDILGYDGVIYTATDGTHEFVSLVSNQFKDIDNINPTSNPDINRSLKGGMSNEEIRKTVAEYAEGGKVPTEKYNELIKTYGAITKGEKPHRDVKVPAQTAEDKKVSQTVRTILEAEVTPDEAVPTIEKMVEDGVFSYDVYTDQEAIENGEDYIKEHGWEQSLVDWFDAVNKGEVSKDTTTTGWILYNHAANSGDAKTALMILDAMVRHQRSAAQALQATRILKKLSPETQLYGVQKSVSAFQNELKEKYGKKAPDLEIDEELAEQFLNAETQEERDAVIREIYKDIGIQMTSNWLDKWNAWRYLAMLGNPRTHIRNIAGNAFFAPVVLTKDLFATPIEYFAHKASRGKMQRSKSILWGSKSDIALLQAAWNDYANVADLVSNGGKYNDYTAVNARSEIEEGRKIFKSKLFAPVEWARKGNSKLLEVEDIWFSKPHYAYALAQYCKANNITAEQIAKGKAIAPAREYAIKEAQKATYKDTNGFSQMVSEWGRNRSEKNAVKRAFNIVVEGVLPFRKTPANILVRGVEYSPLGLLKGLTRDLYKVAKGEMNAHEAIDNISAGLTGTGLLALGIYLAAEGLIRGHGEDEEDERKFKEMQGHQSYSLELPDGTSITLDWLAPEALPFFVGVNLWESTQGSKEETNLSAMLKSVSNITEPMLEMSCLQGLNDLIEGVGNAASNETSGLMAILSSAVTSYLTQGIPTLAGQIERTKEEERMTTYTEKNSFLTGDMQYILGKASAKIPGWDYAQIPYVDAWGRREASGTALNRGLNNFLNPAYTSEIESSETEKELLRLYEQTGDASVFPERAEKSFTVDGEDKHLTAAEYVKYAELKGQKSYKLITELLGSDAYKSLDDEGKVRAIKDAYDYANQKAKQAISNFKPQAWVSEADEFGEAENYISFRTVVKETETSHKDNGEKFTKADYVEIVSDMAETDDEAWKMYLAEYDSVADIKAEKFDIDPVVYMTARIEMGNIKADYIYNGERVDGNSLTDEQRKNAKQVKNSRKEKIVSYLNSVCDNEKDYLYLLGIEYSSITDDDDYVSYFGK